MPVTRLPISDDVDVDAAADVVDEGQFLLLFRGNNPPAAHLSPPPPMIAASPLLAHRYESSFLLCIRG